MNEPDSEGLAYGFLRDACLALPGAFECFPFGPDTAVFKVQASDTAAAKVFALLWPRQDSASINLKCEPELAVQLRVRYEQVTPGYHMNKMHWNSLLLNDTDVDAGHGFSSALAADMVEDSYDLIVSALPKRDRILLGWAPSH